MARFQYQQITAPPVVPATATVVVFGVGGYAVPASIVLIQYAGVTAPMVPPVPEAISCIGSNQAVPKSISVMQYTALAGPMIQPIGHLGWQGKYPDKIDPETGLRTAAHPWLFTGATSSTIPYPDTRWAPYYPDKIDRKTYLTAQQAWLFTGATSSTIPSTDLRWEGIYPDRIDRLTLPPGQYPWLFTGATSSTIPVTDLRWEAVYPDRIDRLVLLAANQLAYVTSFYATLPSPFPDLSWKPVYPDWLATLPAIPTGAQQALAWTFGPVNPLGHIGWQGTYPDKIDRTSLPPAAQPWLFTGATSSTIPGDLRWEGIYPDKIDRLTYLTANQSWPFSLDPFPRPAAVIQPYVWYPDWFPARTKSVEAGGVAPLVLTFTDLRWAPVSPDWIARKLFDAAQQQAQTYVLFIPVNDLRWAGVYPDRIQRTTLPTADQLATALSLHATIPITDLRWKGQYPDRVIRATMLAALQPWSGAMNLVPIPNPPSTGVDEDDKLHIGTEGTMAVRHVDVAIGNW